MPKRRCLACPVLTPNTRCDTHRKILKARRNADAPMAQAVVANATHCAVCGLSPTPTDPLTMGHVHTPFIRGGQATPDNVQPEHRSCNSRKRDRT